MPAELMKRVLFLQERIDKIQECVNKQAEDECLWFQTRYASEAYLQQALRELHAVIEEGIEDAR